MTNTDRVGSLDGLRGLASLWVVLGHASLLTGFRVPIISSPNLAVDLFIVLSGYLMAFHYLLRQAKAPWSAPSTWFEFWTKRFFRIAPTYYVLLAAALVLGPWLFQMREHIGSIVPGQSQSPERYLDAGLANIVTHVTFVFGQIPWFHYRTVLPDWSIGLEMAFYASFPFLMLLGHRVGFIPMAIGVAIICALGQLVFPDFYGAFQQPSFLPLKLKLFLAGMLLATAKGSDGFKRMALLVTALALAGLDLDMHNKVFVATRLAIVGGLAVMVEPFAYPGAAISRRLADALASRAGFLLGEASYAVYLLHLLVLIPAAAFALDTTQEPALRFALALAITLPLCGLCAWGLHVAVEKPGIALGRVASARVRGAMQRRVQPAE